MTARCFHLFKWAYGHARTVGRCKAYLPLTVGMLTSLSLSVFLISQLKAQNSVAGEGRVARAAQVTGTFSNSQAKVSGNTFTYECIFDGPAKVDNYALVSAREAGECHDSGIKATEPKMNQSNLDIWMANNLYLGVIKQVKELGDTTVGSIAVATVTASGAQVISGWVTTDSGNTSTDAKPKPKPKVAAPEQAAQQLTQLRELAHKKGLRWGIHCREDSSDPDKLFLAYAEPRSMPKLAMYIEEGAQPQWLLPAPSQEAAVRLLYRAIQRAPNYYPEHRPTHKHKPCPAPLEGE